MQSTLFSYPITIKESYLDTFGHVNNAIYLVLFEEARWDLVTQNGFGMKMIQETGLGPTILEIKLRFIKELRLREKITIETKIISYKKKIGVLSQKMIRDGEVCCEAELTISLFSVAERKLVSPTPEWLKAVGIEKLA